MGYFKKEKHTASDSKQKFWIYEPTTKRGKDVVYVKGKNKAFVTLRRK